MGERSSSAGLASRPLLSKVPAESQMSVLQLLAAEAYFSSHKKAPDYLVRTDAWHQYSHEDLLGAVLGPFCSELALA